MALTEHPLAAVVSAFLAGILLAAFAPWLALAGGLVLALLAGLFALTRRPFWGLAALLAAFTLLGSARYLTEMLRPSNDVGFLRPTFLTLTGEIVSDAQVFDGERPFALLIVAARQVEREEEGRLPVSGRVLVRLPLRPAGPNGLPERLPRYGETLRVRGRLEPAEGARNPGGYDYRAYLARRGIYRVMRLKRPEDAQVLPQARPGGNPLLHLAYALRQRTLRHAQETFSPERAALLNGILLGTRADLPDSLNDAFARAGTAHILSTSGVHTALVAGMLLGLTRWLRIGRRVGLVLTALALWLFVFMAGSGPAIVRAAVMASVVMLGLALEREPNLGNALALAALILLLENPFTLFDIGFQLSFAAVLGILLALPLAEEAMSGLNAAVPRQWPGAKALRWTLQVTIGGLFVGMAAQLGTAPLVAYYFNLLPLVAVPANLLTALLTAGLLALGFPAAALAALHPTLSWPLDRLLDLLLGWTIGLTEWFAGLPFAALAVPSPPLWLIGAYYALLGGLLWRFRRKRL